MAEWVPVRKAAQVRKCSERNIYNLVKKGILQSKKEGGKLLVLMDIPEESSEVDPKISEMISVLQKQIEEKDKQIERLQAQLEGKDKQIAEASHRHDTVVMQMTRLVEYHQQPFWRRWRKQKQLPEATIIDEEQ